jgi:hypothetical protein
MRNDMKDDTVLAHLFGAYLNQDVFDFYSDEFEAVADFATQEPERARLVAAELDRLLAQSDSEVALKAELDAIGVEIRPVMTSYREWLTRIAERVRALTSAGGT